MCVSAQALLRPFAQLVSRRKGRNMKIKYRFISETTEIKASDDWGDLFLSLSTKGTTWTITRYTTSLKPIH